MNRSTVKPTGYWTFFCNPKKWAIDDFLMSGKVYDTFSITHWQKDWFKKGQLGVIRVGHDQRTKKQLNGKPRLKPGIYAIVEILNTPIISADRDDYWLEKDESEKETYRVEIKYLKNLLCKPIPLEYFSEENAPEYDKYLVKGFQASSMPLNPQTFQSIIKNIGGIETLDFEFNHTEIHNYDDISDLERKYLYSVPEVKERVSKYIERGKIAQEYKRLTGYKCQICDALGLNPYTFKKPDGQYYIETHHVIPVSELKVGTLSTKNLITVCPNHHRQLHYGKASLLENTDEKFVFEIDSEIIEVKKV